MSSKPITEHVSQPESAGKPSDWISDGEKYALIGLTVKIEQPIPFRQLVPGLWVWTDRTLDVPADWREWLGSIRSKEIESCNLVLLSKMVSHAPDLLDGENEELKNRVWGFYNGLLLASRFATRHRPIVLTGSRRGDDIHPRQESSLDIPVACVFRGYPAVLRHDVEKAAQLASNYLQLLDMPPKGGEKRIFRALDVYMNARSKMRLLDRLHQYCRCIDGLILSEPGSGAKQFKSRTELFIGPRHHGLIGKMYVVRSDVEHLHEHRYLETFDRMERLELVQQEAIAEHIARNALAHIITNPALWRHFGNTAALGPFWQLPLADRQKLWGSVSIKPADALADFDPNFISDGDLGA
jgi:hypothetical protein